MSKSSNRDGKLSRDSQELSDLGAGADNRVVNEESTAFRGSNGDGADTQFTAAGASPEGWEDEVTREAYELYRQRGYVDGHDVDDWFEAQRRIRQRREAMGADDA